MSLHDELVGGTRCIVDQTAATEVAAVGIWFAQGSRDETSENAGSTHFIEHMLFKGTPSRTAAEIAREIDRLGGSANAYTERETVSVFALVPSEGLAQTVDIIKDIVGNSNFDEKEFELERSVIENELAAAEDDPEEMASDAFAESFWQGHGLGKRIGGTLKDLQRLNREEVLSRYRSDFAAQPDLITVAGDVEAEPIQQAFSHVFTAPQKRHAREMPNLNSNDTPVYKTANFQHIQFFCAFQLPGFLSHEDYYALQVANSAMGESMSSRLFQSLREEKGICYSINSASSIFSDISLWTIYASVTSESLPLLIEGIADELTEYRSKPFSVSEVADAVSQLRGSMKIAALDIEHRMRRIARQALYGLTPITVSDSSALVASINQEKANAALTQYLELSRPFLFAVGPASAKRVFLKSADLFLERQGVSYVD